MANEVVKLDLTKVPSFVRTREGMSDVTKALMGGGGGGFGGKRLSLKGGVFRLLVGGKEVSSIDERYLDVIVINAAPKVSRTFYGEKFNEEAVSGPKCWSPDGEKPDPAVKAPQSNACATCPQNVKGSGDGDSKACRYSQRLALLLANDPEGDVLQFTVPAQSLFGKEEGDSRPLQSYSRYLAINNIGVDEVVTRMRFDTKSSHPKLFFKAERWLTDAEHAAAKEKAQSADAKQAITMTVSQMDNVPPALPGSRPAAPAAPAEETPKAETKRKPKAEAKAETEPTVRNDAKPAPAAAAAKKDVQDLVHAWDSDD